MQLASISGVFRTILIIVLVYYILKYVMRLFVGASAKGSAQNSDPRGYQNNKKEGDITIEYLNKKKANGDHDRPDDADPVDFEEIKDRS